MMPPRFFRPAMGGVILACLLLAAAPAWSQDATPTDPASPSPLPPAATATPVPPATPEPSAAPSAVPALADTKTETIVFIRHGEKPPADNGQLTVQGLNRALALPDVLIGKFGRADFIFAPATTKKTSSHHLGTFAYVRPLTTIEPTAIRLGLPVETKFAYDEIAGLQSELCTPAYQKATVFVVWEHHLLNEMVRHLVTAFGGNAEDVPEWSGDDFDSIYVVRLRTDAQGKRSVSFEHDLERLNDESSTFPAPAARP